MKKLFVLLLSIVMVFSMVACGGSNEATDTTTEAKDEAVKIGVTIYKFDDILNRINPYKAKRYENNS